jgi:hypothetical protein
LADQLAVVGAALEGGHERQVLRARPAQRDVGPQAAFLRLMHET